METLEELAIRLERTADWNGHLRACERADLRDAALRLRDLAATQSPPDDPSSTPKPPWSDPPAWH